MTKDAFTTAFGHAPEHVEAISGRVNLIGEHIDYNGGTVLPTAVTLGMQLAVTRRADDAINVHSREFDTALTSSVGAPRQNDWADYVFGTVNLANELGLLNGGLDVYMASDIPVGAGLSSSAALTVGLLKAARTLSGQSIPDPEIAQLARRVENEYIGVPCGIMDQMAVAIARPGQALALDTRNLDFELVDLPQGYDIAVLHSGQYRKHSDGDYKVRKEECDRAKAGLGTDDLCLLGDADLAAAQAALDDIAFRRTRHCVTEHRRTLDALAALRAGNIARFGELMNQSHVSMRDDFEMSKPPIDRLVEDAAALGAIGARLTGGGFGGCIVACVSSDKRQNWEAELLARHPAAFHVC